MKLYKATYCLIWHHPLRESYTTAMFTADSFEDALKQAQHPQLGVEDGVTVSLEKLEAIH